MSGLIQTLPAHWYFDPEIFRLEKAQIFRKNWNYICPEESLAMPGEYVTDEIGGQSIVLVRLSDNEISGYLNLCRHRASPLCLEKQGDLDAFTCPYHAWQYSLDGDLVSAPGFDEALDKKNFSLYPIKVDIWNGLVFACIDHAVPVLLEWLGDIASIASDYPALTDLEFYSMRENHCPANWKNYSDNSAEGYHLGSIHLALSQSLVRTKTRIEAYPDGKFVGFSVSYREPDGGESPGFWIYKFPGLLIHFSCSGFNVERVIPVDSVSAKMQRWFWFSAQVDCRARTETIAFSNQVMDEDMGICARVQKNLEAGIYDRGVLSPEREPGTIFFQSCVRDALNGN